jgi:hypothetical protein
MWDLPFVCGNCPGEEHGACWNFLGVFSERSVVEVSQNKAAEREWPKWGRDRDSAILILAEG